MQKLVPAALFLALLVMAGCQEPVKQEVITIVNKTPPPSRGPGDVIPGDPPPQAEDFGTEEEAAYFRQYLEPHGSWIEVEQYGVCWQPHNIAPDWKPYTLGHWDYTDDSGWLWASDEPFGWCCYHYGRWAFTSSFGWVWVPGRQWSPAWVSWRHGAGYIGWAPLPPVRQRIDIAIEMEAVPHWCFNFVEERYITDPNLRERIDPVTRNITLLNVTRNITRYEFLNGRFIDRGVDINYLEKIIRIPRSKLTEATSVREMGMHGEEIAIFRPQLPPRPPRTADSQPPASRWLRVPAPSHAVAQLAQRGALLAPYHERLEGAMKQRHALEMQRPPIGFSPAQMMAVHEGERMAFLAQRKCERDSVEHVPMYMGWR
jgi:hypothetical protein